MNWSEAKAKAKAGLHVRRAAWPDEHWLIYQRGNAWFWNGFWWRVVEAGDFGIDEFAATDWTTTPPALAACPIDGGGVDGPDPDDPDGPDGPGGGGGGHIIPIPPEPDPTPPPGPRPTPPGPTPPPPACISPVLTLDHASIACVGGETVMEVHGTLTGGTGSWSVKARALFIDYNIGLLSGDHGAFITTVSPFTCTDGAMVRVDLVATGMGACGGWPTLRQHVSIPCVACIPPPACSTADNLSVTLTNMTDTVPGYPGTTLDGTHVVPWTGGGWTLTLVTINEGGGEYEYFYNLAITCTDGIYSVVVYETLYSDLLFDANGPIGVVMQGPVPHWAGTEIGTALITEA